MESRDLVGQRVECEAVVELPVVAVGTGVHRQIGAGSGVHEDVAGEGERAEMPAVADVARRDEECAQRTDNRGNHAR